MMLHFLKLFKLPPGEKVSVTILKILRYGYYILRYGPRLPKDFELIKYRPILNYMHFADRFRTMDESFKSNVYIGRGSQSLPALLQIKERFGGAVYCDMIEVPEFGKRAVKSPWNKTMLEIIDTAFPQMVTKLDGTITVSNALSDLLLLPADKKLVLPNYREYSAIKVNKELRSQLGLTKEKILGVSIGTHASGLENFLTALKNHKDLHIAFIGTFFPPDLKIKTRQKVQELGLLDRVFFLPPIAYENLIDTLNDANFGLIIRDTSLLNNAISLPNRVFDYLSSEIPILSENIPDIKAINQKFESGICIEDGSIESWDNGLTDITVQLSTFTAGAKKAAQSLVWDKICEELYQFLGKPKSVSFVSYVDVYSNNRTMRMLKSLKSFGCDVKVCCPDKKNQAPKMGYKHFSFEEKNSIL